MGYKKNLSMGGQSNCLILHELNLEPRDNMKEINQDFIYQAMGWIKGEVIRDSETERSKVRMAEGVEFDLFIKKRLLEKIEFNNEYWLKVYPRYLFASKAYSFTLVKALAEPPDDLELKIPNIFILKGRYELLTSKCPEEEKKPYMAIYRNFHGGSIKKKIACIREKNLVSFIPLDMGDRLAFDRENMVHENKMFYQVLARFDPETKIFYFLRDICEPSKERPKRLKNGDIGKLFQLVPPRKSSNVERPILNTEIPIAEEIVMINGKIPEIVIKFEEKPVVPAEGKKVNIEVNSSDTGVKVKALLNRKTLKKLVEKMDSYESWIGSLSGKIKEIHPDGVVELDRAGMQVFEKKPKESQEPQEKNPEKNEQQSQEKIKEAV